MAMDPHNFVGDYFYQQSRKESVNMAELADRMQWILGNLAKNRPKHRFPANILILRDGLSEGQFCMVKVKIVPKIIKIFIQRPLARNWMLWRKDATNLGPKMASKIMHPNSHLLSAQNDILNDFLLVKFRKKFAICCPVQWWRKNSRDPICRPNSSFNHNLRQK